MFLKKQIEIVLSEINPKYFNPKPSRSMLFLLIITAPFDCRLFTTKLKPGTINNCETILPSADLGPVVTGIRELIRLPLQLNDCNLIQVFGHYSVGIGASIANVSLDPISHKSLLVNLDVTNTFSHTNANVITSKTMLIYNKGQLTIHTFLNTTNMPQLYQNNIIPPMQKIFLIEQNLHEMSKIQEYITKRFFDTPDNKPPYYCRLFFHGIDITHKHAIFTLNKNKYGWPFVAKSIFIGFPTVPGWLQSIITQSNF